MGMRDIPTEDRVRLMIEYGGRCAICGHDESNGRLILDHDHVSGHIRGVLCHPCNLILGMAGDGRDVDWTATLLESAARYIRG